MKKNQLYSLIGLSILLQLIPLFPVEAQEVYEPTWKSLNKFMTPQWLRDGKFGIYTHWGVYSVPAQGPNGTWYANQVYVNPASPQRKYHEATYGKLEDFGYKDFIPMFTGEKFNAEEWADLFEKAGARFAGPVAEHHDGFAMWNTKYTEWNAVKMGPKRDVVGELSKAIRNHNMKFLTAFHHAEEWFYFPTWDKRYDCGDPKYSSLYGPIHEPGERPSKAFLEQWQNKITEVIGLYEPDFIWFDFGLELIAESYKKEMLANYYNWAVKNRKEVVVSYKGHDLPPGTGLVDYEQGQEGELTYYEWITDTSIDDGQGWGYVKGLGFKSVDNLIDNLVDRVSKNGYLLLNVGPKPDGTIPEEARQRLLAMGEWLRMNGEAIYGTSAWVIAGEGPTKLGGAGENVEKNDLIYTGQDFRFTVKDDNLYVIALDWPGEKMLIKSFAPKGKTWAGLYPSEITSITMLGDGKELKWEMTKEGLIIETPKTKPCEHAYAIKIVRRKPL